MALRNSPRVEITRSEDGEYVEANFTDGQAGVRITIVAYLLKPELLEAAVEAAFYELTGRQVK